MSPARKAESDVVVVGGGVIGCATARALLRAGATVTLVERHEPGAGATRAAAGMLSPLGEAREVGPFLKLARASLARYGTFVEELEAETGSELLFELTGRLHPARTEGDLGRLREHHRWLARNGLDGKWLEEEEIRRLDPGMGEGVLGGLHLEEDGQVDSRRLGRALGRACQSAGVRMLPGREVREVVVDRGRVRGVRLDGGEEIRGEAVLVAAGCWSGCLEGLPGSVPIRPVRGQVVALGPVHRDRLPRWTLATPDCYLVPRPDGRLIVGATEEEAGFRATTTAEGITGLLQGALGAYPGVADLPLLETWAGLRPGTPDDLPILGPDPDAEGLFWATGHYRNGILLAPVTAEILAAQITGEVPPLDPAPFDPGRFRGGDSG